MQSSLCSLLILTLTLVLPSITSAGVSTLSDLNLTAYQILQTYGFPVGILPLGITGYELDQSTGEFKVYLNSDSCRIPILSWYQLHYKNTISGMITKDRLYNISGLSVRDQLIWRSVVEVLRHGDDLEFYAGLRTAFGIENFYKPPQCGCGFSCNGLNYKHKIGVGNAKLRVVF